MLTKSFKEPCLVTTCQIQLGEGHPGKGQDNVHTTAESRSSDELLKVMPLAQRRLSRLFNLWLQSNVNHPTMFKVCSWPGDYVRISMCNTHGTPPRCPQRRTIHHSSHEANRSQQMSRPAVRDDVGKEDWMEAWSPVARGHMCETSMQQPAKRPTVRSIERLCCNEMHSHLPAFLTPRSEIEFHRAIPCTCQKKQMSQEKKLAATGRS